jgi:sigma-54 dependent transcriptional regulator, acetoin dehydrogenase operon transcriptional activator AcoR
VVAVVGEPGSGRATLLAQAMRHQRPRGRILSASAPAPTDVEPWLALWTPEVGKPHTSVIVRHVDALPTWVAERLRDLSHDLRSGDHDEPGREPLSFTSERFEDIPSALRTLVDTVVHVPPLRERVEDLLPLAQHAARRARGRDIAVTSAALHALENYAWPGNVSHLQRVVREAALHTDSIDLGHLPPEILSGSTRKLSRIEAFERDEIIRVLTRPGITMRDAAEELGMSRATIYRKLAHLDIHLPRT